MASLQFRIPRFKIFDYLKLISLETTMPSRNPFGIHICELTRNEWVSPKFQATYPNENVAQFHPHSFQVTRIKNLNHCVENLRIFIW